MLKSSACNLLGLAGPSVWAQLPKEYFMRAASLADQTEVQGFFFFLKGIEGLSGVRGVMLVEVVMWPGAGIFGVATTSWMLYLQTVRSRPGRSYRQIPSIKKRQCQ